MSMVKADIDKVKEYVGQTLKLVLVDLEIGGVVTYDIDYPFNNSFSTVRVNCFIDSTKHSHFMSSEFDITHHESLVEAMKIKVSKRER